MVQLKAVIFLQELMSWSLYVQWNLYLTKCQGTGEIGSLYRGFVISRFFSIHYTITGMKNIVRYTEGFAI